MKSYRVLGGPRRPGNSAIPSPGRASHESAARGVAISVQMPEMLPMVRGDQVQLQQVLLSLIMNGMEARRRRKKAAGRRWGHVRLLASGTREQRSMNGAGAIVYVVDDDESVRRTTERLIRSMGCYVQTFASG